jgi:endonuclease YncB( thermonuclease family)
LGPALFLCLLAAGCSAEAPVTPGAGCAAADPERLEAAVVEYVHDGDTLRLRGGDSLRLIGINTPELSRDGAPAEPGAEAARRSLAALVANGRIWLEDGVDQRDRYGRRLAWVFDRHGRSLSGILLRQGHGFHVAVSPNFAYADCLAGQEASAREQGLGVWAEPGFRPRGAADLVPGQSGFQRLRDEVTHVSFKDNGWWLQLGGKVGLRIRSDSQDLFSRAQLKALHGQTVEVRGWLIPRDGNWWMMNLDHPSMLR